MLHPKGVSRYDGHHIRLGFQTPLLIILARVDAARQRSRSDV
jgi:hypothetical protein